MSDYAEWLVGIARRIGLTRGESATGFGEINAWCECGIDLTLWERETVSAISSAFVSALHRFRDAEVLPPWMPEGARERLAQQMADFDDDFGALSGPAKSAG